MPIFKYRMHCHWNIVINGTCKIDIHLLLECYLWMGCFQRESLSHLFSCYSWLITGFITRVTHRVQHKEQELLTLPEHLSSPSTGRSCCLIFCPLSFGHCVPPPPFFWTLCSLSSIYGFFKLFGSQYVINVNAQVQIKVWSGLW